MRPWQLTGGITLSQIYKLSNSYTELCGEMKAKGADNVILQHCQSFLYRYMERQLSYQGYKEHLTHTKRVVRDTHSFADFQKRPLKNNPSYV